MIDYLIHLCPESVESAVGDGPHWPHLEQHGRDLQKVTLKIIINSYHQP
jgi:hypothetical protein